MGCAASSEESIELQSTNIDSIPTTVFNNKDLLYLDVSTNRIAEFDPQITTLTKLHTLQFSSNCLRTIPSSIGSLTSLVMFVYCLSISPIPRIFVVLSLNLSYNRLDTLPDCFQSLTSLQDLDLSYNQLTIIPQSISLCVSLRRLNLQRNKLEELPNEIGTLDLRSLNVTENSLLSQSLLKFIDRPDGEGLLRGFLKYRLENPLSPRFEMDISERIYYSDHGLRRTYWIDPRFYDYIRTLKYNEKRSFDLSEDPLAIPITQETVQEYIDEVNNHEVPSWVNEFQNDLPCTNPQCPAKQSDFTGTPSQEVGRTTMACPYRLCLNCCVGCNCPHHALIRQQEAAQQQQQQQQQQGEGEGQDGEPQVESSSSSSSSEQSGDGQADSESLLAHRQSQTGMSVMQQTSILRSVTFQKKARELRVKLDQMHPFESQRIQDRVRMICRVRRTNYLEDAFQAFMNTHINQLRFRLEVVYDGEEGLDWGGLTRDFFANVLPTVCNPNYALFTPSEGNKYAYWINPLSSINPDHLIYFRFIGRVLGKALYDNQVVTVYFTPIFYKKLIGIPCILSDLEFFDPELYRSLVDIQENDPADLDLNFTVTEVEFDVAREIELVPNGQNITVTKANKEQFIKLMLEHKLSYKTTEQMDAIRRGFQDVIPLSLIRNFTAPELELMLCGTSSIDVDDWKRNTNYVEFTVDSPTVRWWWQMVDAMTEDERAQLLYFITGTSKVPVGGFAALIGSTGPHKFTINRINKDANYLPRAHTCFNQIDIPVYPNKQHFLKKIRTAVAEAGNTFGDR